MDDIPILWGIESGYIAQTNLNLQLTILSPVFWVLEL